MAFRLKSYNKCVDQFLYNNKYLRDRRRELRNKPTPAEKFLWTCLSKRQVQGLLFNRQYSVGPYILDFYCPKVRLAIEVDGSQHNTEEGKIYDTERDRFLNSANIHTLRFWNNEVLKNIDNVLGQINQKIVTIQKSK